MRQDYILIIQLNNDSAQAFAALHQKYAGKLYNYVHSMLRDTELAEDITQSCFMTVWEKRHSIDPMNNFPAWLYVVARNAVYQELRRLVLRTRYIDALRYMDDLTQSTVADHEINLNMLQEAAEKVIEKQPEARRRIFLMSSRDQMSNAEIAKALNISPKTVETQLRRTILALRKHLSKYMTIAALLHLFS